ncbi:MAG TPA: phosphoribosylanthranilate isomerase [Opitutaceae bacterium]|nr:phosphoribosylanthranilate isomerase [Opitutaceae bacterium]
MIGSVRVKVCGLTTAEDAAAAGGIGADFLGFILYPKSPRYLPLAQFVALRAQLPALPKVAVMVQPTEPELAAVVAAGFDFFQIHFPVTNWTVARDVAATVGAERLWLAPKLPPETELPVENLALARTWLLDTYRADSFGGTGHTGDWVKFRRYREAHPDRRWILAGGLAPDNAAAALAATGAETLDVNSGVEASPGRKDPAKLAALRTVLLR